MQLTTDLDKHLVEIPGVTTSALSFLQLPSVIRPEPVAPLPNGFIGDDNSTFGQKVFHVSKTQTETVIQPNCVTDNCRMKSVSVV
jgi:hypothetical protein